MTYIEEYTPIMIRGKTDVYVSTIMIKFQAKGRTLVATDIG